MTDSIARMARISKTLEDRFFFSESLVLTDQLTRLKRQQETEEALSRVSGIVNKTVLGELVALRIRPGILSALCLVPIIEVAWASGRIEEQERKAVLDGAKKFGFGEDQAILHEWLIRKPDATLLDAWKVYLQGLCEVLSSGAIAALQAEITEHTKAVAEASGGFLGLVNPISAAELRVLDSIAAFFSEPGPCRP